jgi:uncharacterized protein DUF3800
METRSYLFVDESGEPGCGAPGDRYRQYLCLTGCAICHDPYVTQVKKALDALKGRHFSQHPTKPVALHRADVLRREGPFSCLSDPACAAAFDADLLSCYANLPYTLITVVIDKIAHDYDPKRFLGDAYHWALALMLERYCKLLTLDNRIGRVVCEARGKRPDQLLQKAYDRIYQSGTTHVRHPASFFQRTLASRKISFRQKYPPVAGLEVADGLAKAAKMITLADNGRAPRPTTPFAVALEAAIEPKWNRRRLNGQVAGYGKVFFTLQVTQK